MNKIVESKEEKKKTFEDIKHINEYGDEYWYARELQAALEYKEWRNFKLVINRAKHSCKGSNYNVSEHFVDVNKTIKMPKDAEKIFEDFKLTRYACYLIVQNGDSRKEVIALGQTYFAVQTRKQELSEQEYEELPEIEKRFYQRNITRKGNYSFQQTAKKAGVKDMAGFHNAGYIGLYNGRIYRKRCTLLSW